jgi:hypothetical protein
MTRSNARWVGAFCVTLLLGCSRSGDSSTDARGTTSAPVHRPLPPPLPASAEAPLGAGSVLTPEDAEDDAAHRITEQNLESELDRLEREIQAE